MEQNFSKIKFRRNFGYTSRGCFNVPENCNNCKLPFLSSISTRVQILRHNFIVLFQFMRKNFEWKRFLFSSWLRLIVKYRQTRTFGRVKGAPSEETVLGALTCEV